mgnify:CR=1 FL=1
MKDSDRETANDSFAWEPPGQHDQVGSALAVEPSPEELAPAPRPTTTKSLLQRQMGNQALVQRRPRGRQPVGREDVALQQRTLGNQTLLGRGGAEGAEGRRSHAPSTEPPRQASELEPRRAEAREAHPATSHVAEPSQKDVRRTERGVSPPPTHTAPALSPERASLAAGPTRSTQSVAPKSPAQAIKGAGAKEQRAQEAEPAAQSHEEERQLLDSGKAKATDREGVSVAAAVSEVQPKPGPEAAEAALSEERETPAEKQAAPAAQPVAAGPTGRALSTGVEAGGSFAMPAVPTSAPAHEGGLPGKATEPGGDEAASKEEEGPEEAVEAAEEPAAAGEASGGDGEKAGAETQTAAAAAVQEAPAEAAEGAETASPTDVAPMEPGPAAALPQDMSGSAAAAAEEPATVDAAAIAAQPPAAALASAAPLPPSQAVVAIGAVQGSLTADIAQKREELSSSSPAVDRPIGSVRTKIGPAVEPETPAPRAAVKRVPDRGAAPVPAPVPLPPPGPIPTDRVHAPAVSEATPEGGISEADAAKLGDAIDAVPSRDKELYLTAGPAPQVPLEGDADPGKAHAQENEVHAKSAELRAEGAQDVARPMGEGDIYPVVPRETLRAKVTPGAGGGKASRPAAGAAIDPNIGVLADLEKGDEVRAAAAEGQAKLAAARADQVKTSQEERRKSDENIRRMVSENAVLQESERQGAKSGSANLRRDWSAGQQQLVDKAEKDLSKERQSLDVGVARETKAGDAIAQSEIDTGNEEAAKARVEAERKAAAEKAKKPSTGFFGWLASKAKAFFDLIKAAVKGIFDEARKTVRWAIDKAKTLAVAAIEKARHVVVGLIRIAGPIILAVGDRLLADFPKLRDKFRVGLRVVVATAEKAVNALAEKLKKNVVVGLDLLGKGLDAALGFLEKTSLAIVDGYAKAVAGAIKAAEATANTFGVFVVLVKDIAAAPMPWLKKLGAAMWNGIKNFLWGQLVADVKEWGKAKLMEITGLAGVIFSAGMSLWDVLKQGGMDLAAIFKMAWPALLDGLKSALIETLIEKLVSMLVPAAALVKAIIDGLRAGWNTVKRILAAFERFVEFLRSVKAGTEAAAKNFARVVSAAAVAVLDFVANWLLQKMKGVGSKIVGKLRDVASKIWSKVKGVATKIWARVKASKLGKKLKAWSEKRKAMKKPPTPEQRAKAIAAVKSAVIPLLQKGVGKTRLALTLAYLKLRYRFTTLQVRREAPDRAHLYAEMSPGEVLLDFTVVDSAKQTKEIEKLLGTRVSDYINKNRQQVTIETIALGMSVRQAMNTVLASDDRDELDAALDKAFVGREELKQRYLDHKIRIVKGTVAIRASLDYAQLYSDLNNAGIVGPVHHVIPLWMGGGHGLLIALPPNVHKHLHSVEATFRASVLRHVAAFNTKYNTEVSLATTTPRGEIVYTSGR